VLRLSERLIAAVGAGDSETVGELFNVLPADLRRPVEILGLLHLLTADDESFAVAANAEYDGESDGELDRSFRRVLEDAVAFERFDSIRPDGTDRQFLVPRLELHAAGPRRSPGLDEGTPA
jgi:hypothetical protein